MELERTLVVGEPTEEQRRYFQLMLEAQQLGLSMLRPGVLCSEVDREVQRFYRERGIDRYWRHHTGHSIGLSEHESPFLDIGDDTVIQENMVFTVEPGVYVPRLGGFRHSDTVLVTSDGSECLTGHPRALEELIIR